MGSIIWVSDWRVKCYKVFSPVDTVGGALETWCFLPGEIQNHGGLFVFRVKKKI